MVVQGVPVVQAAPISPKWKLPASLLYGIPCCGMKFSVPIQPKTESSFPMV